MLLKTIVQASLIGAALAQPLQHQHHQHNEQKRAVEYVTSTDIVIVNGGTGETETLPPVSVSSATTVSVSSATGVPQVVPSSFSNPTTFETKTSGSPSSAPSGSSSGGNSSPAKGKGISYSPYSDNGGCKSSSQIASEVAQLSSYDIIRLYGVDCNQVGAVMAAKSSSQKIFAGIFDVANIESGVQTLASAVKANGGWDHIHTVSVGNELVNSGQASVSQIGQYVQTAKSALSSAGYNGPVVSVDTFIAVINNPGLCDHSDYMAVNAHAFFDGQVSADQAGNWVLQQIERVHSACGGLKSVFVSETGWPSKGTSNGVAVPSKENQEAAVSSISSKAGDDSILFTAFNDLWKADGDFGCEKYWGILSN